MGTDSPPLLSVCLITYNHAAYVRQAIESILSQRVSFRRELIIADDFSTDGTRDILLEYKSRYPDTISLILQEKNVGPAQNWLDLIMAPKSEYIAYLEGDDYWTDPHKLQKQVDVLEQNPHISLTCTDGIVVDENNAPLDIVYKKPSTEIFTLENSFTDNPCTSGSILYRTKYLRHFPGYITRLAWGDYALHLHLLRHGPGILIDEKMAAYRVHAGGVWSAIKKQQNNKKELQQYFNFYASVYPHYRAPVLQENIKKYARLIIRNILYEEIPQAKREKDRKKGLRLLREAAKYNAYAKELSFRDYIHFFRGII